MLLDHDGYLFVCGDGNKMAKDVRVCLEEAFMRHRGMSDKEARKTLAGLMKDHHFVMDIWST